MGERVEQLAAAVVAVHAYTQRVAHLDVSRCGRPDTVSRHSHGQRAAVHRSEWLADVEAQFGVQAHRAVVVGSVQQTHAGYSPLGASLQQRVHHGPPDMMVLPIRSDRHVPHPDDHRALVKVAASHDPPTALSDHAEETRMCDQPRHQRGREVGRREFGRKSVLISD